jgi:ATP-dependent helicase/nuclease subunit B
MDDIAINHHALRAWARVADAIHHAIAQRGVHASRTVVLLPFAQLMPLARAAWLEVTAGQGAPALFLPRFETTLNWARSLGAPLPGGDDLRMDAARDLLTAGTLMARSGLERRHPELARPLMQAAWSLARVAAAVPPAGRLAWGARMAESLDALSLEPVLEVESWVGRVALAWAASSSYATDVLFSADAELLVIVEGFQPEPVPAALAAQRPEATLVFRLAQDAPAATDACLHRALDAEDEAQRSAACVLAHLQAGRSPVALVAQDRLLTRRVRAMLADAGVAVRDETGWTLSTTRAAATVMTLLRACVWNASCDAVLEWVKNVPALAPDSVARFERDLRRAGVSEWQRVGLEGPVVDAVQALRVGLQSARPLTQWLPAVRQALAASGQWSALSADVAGQAVIEALRLQDGAETEFAEFARAMPLSAFIAWVGQALESGSFVPPHPTQADVIVLPLSQLLGRAPAAVVLPGCDEVHLPASPEPADLWTPRQRAVLGLPSREALALAARLSWGDALQSSPLDILWRQSAGGEPVMPGVWLLELLTRRPENGQDWRTQRELSPLPCHMPAPSAAGVPLPRLSASSYEDLRRCPYRFFALRLLGLQEQEELEGEIDKRDFGNWLHLVLRHFHEGLRAHAAPAPGELAARLDAAADRASADMGLTEAEFLPFLSTWPRVRSAYLAWHLDHLSTGACFEQAELAMEQQMGPLTLIGRADRIDRLADGTRLVIDYKTESRSKTEARVRNPNEDTQLAFYAALLEDDAPAASYLSIVEGEATRAFGPADIGALRDQLVDALQGDMARIAEGAPMPALGAGSACDFCAARGLCRKDFWASEPSTSGAPHV